MSERKNAIVVGASGGIGVKIIEMLRENQFQVLALSRQKPTIQESNDIQWLPCDLSTPSQVELVLKQLNTMLENLDLLILAAGYGDFKAIEQFSYSQMSNIMQVNFLSQALICKQLLPLMKTTGHSKLIAIVSEAALQGAKKGSMYCASKFAMRGFLQSLRSESVQNNIAITMLHPGLIDTDFFSDLNFKPGSAPENSIRAQQISALVETIIHTKNNCVVEEVILQPLKKVLQKNA